MVRFSFCKKLLKGENAPYNLILHVSAKGTFIWAGVGAGYGKPLLKYTHGIPCFSGLIFTVPKLHFSCHE